MRSRNAPLAISIAAALLAALPAFSDDWTTVGMDAQRSSWVRSDRKVSPETVAGPEFQFLWRMQTSNEARSDAALTAPVLLDFLISHRGFRSLAFVSGSSGGVYTMDTDLARMEWDRHFAEGPSHSSAECPGGMTANVSRNTSVKMPSMLGFVARGRRSPALSGVGQPGAGAVTLAEARPASTARPQQTRPAARTRPPARSSLRGVNLLHVLSNDGMLHGLYVSNGRDHRPPMPFLPANSHARGLVVIENTAFVTTVNRCGGTPDGVWSLDLESGMVRAWESDGGSIAGAAGAAFAPDGMLYAATKEGALVALESRSLNLAQKSRSTGFRSSPVVFDFDGADHLAVLASDGSLQVYAADSLAAPVAAASARSGSVDDDTALAVWKDESGTSWIVVSTGRSIAAWKLAGRAGEMSLEKGWESSAMIAPLPPIVVNGVVFALDGGESAGRATLYALEGTTGAALWDSADSIEAPARGHTLSSGPSHVYLTAMDNAVYGFGIPMEH
ncbi:MAG: hypothetical protein F4Y47_21570 [Acidobacteriia bacterium]|nr:hypothetical protein [Terriglobia bacterium]MYB53733.1 hypothetical protein [Terriglobia bacterium]MYC66092.1 hypothetical protein [Terriglobia bacterium]MYG01268.1 hypothetical protein [Terriglobia bacterium]MYK11510.1 hypothetical protein [Terriglobia bacterium]